MRPLFLCPKSDILIQVWLHIVINFYLDTIFSILVLKIKQPEFLTCTSWCLLSSMIWGVIVMVFNATFNNIPVISWRSVLVVEETRVHGENNRPVASHWQTHNVVSSIPRLSGILWDEKYLFVDIGKIVDHW